MEGSDVANLKKDEVIQIHTILYKLCRALERNGYVDLSEYYEFGVLPSQIFKPKEMHENAVIMLSKILLRFLKLKYVNESDFEQLSFLDVFEKQTL